MLCECNKYINIFEVNLIHVQFTNENYVFVVQNYSIVFLNRSNHLPYIIRFHTY